MVLTNFLGHYRLLLLLGLGLRIHTVATGPLPSSELRVGNPKQARQLLLCHTQEPASGNSSWLKGKDSLPGYLATEV